MLDAPEMMTPGEVADVLRVGTKTVYNLITDGEITYKRINRLIRVPRESLERYLERQTHHSVHELGGQDVEHSGDSGVSGNRDRVGE